MAEELTPSRHRGGRHLVQQRLTQALLSRVVLVLLLACAMCPPAPAAVAAPPHRAHPLAVALPTRQWLPGTAPAQGPAFVGPVGGCQIVPRHVFMAVCPLPQDQDPAKCNSRAAAISMARHPPWQLHPTAASGRRGWGLQALPGQTACLRQQWRGRKQHVRGEAMPTRCQMHMLAEVRSTHQLNAPQGPAPAPAAHGEACKAAAAAAVGALRRRQRGSRVLLGPADSPHTAQAFCKDARVGDCLVGESRGRARSVVLAPGMP